MKSARVLSVLLSLSIFFSAAAVADKACATVLYAIEIERGATETKVHLKADGPIRDYREVRLKKDVAARRPDRMYLDLKQVRLAGPIPVKQVGTALAKVRNARRPEGLRVVFDSGLEHLFAYTISKEPDGLMVTILEPASSPSVLADKRLAPATSARPAKVKLPELVTIRPVAKPAGDLDLLIVTSDNPEQTQEWLAGSAGRRTTLQVLKTAKPTQVINTSFLVTGVSPDPKGDYAVIVSFTLLNPKGKVVLSERGFARTSGRAPAQPAFILAEPVLAIILDETDPTGDYTIIGIVEDQTTNKTVRTSRKISLEK